MSNSIRHVLATVLVTSAFLLASCGGSSSSGFLGIGGSLPDTDSGVPPQTRDDGLCIAPDTNARDKILTRLFQARSGDVVLLCEGRFEMSTGLLINSKRGITLKGAGMDKTILNFANSDSAEGINATLSNGLVLEDFTVEDTPGNGIRVFRSDYITMRNVRARWHDAAGRNEKDPGYTPRPEVGAYGLYPVETRHVLMEGCESHGASDAGIYVGQSSDVIVRNCLATYNVAGFEFENTYRALFEDNVATKNTGGFLVFDLPGLRQFGEKNIVRRNKAFNNNTANFAPVGNIVGLVPRGTGMLVLASDQLEIYDNDIENNGTVGIAVVNYGLVTRSQSDKNYDFFPEGIEIHNNRFSDNGNDPQMPDAERGEASALALLLRLKNQGRGADIIWDGGEDTPDYSCTEYPKDSKGVALNKPNAADKRYEDRVDERGRPNYYRGDTATCKYNLWKFHGDGTLKKPENGLCMRNNQHKFNPSVTPFLNAGLNRADLGPEFVEQVITPGSSDRTPHDCDLPTRADPILELPYKIVAEEQAPLAVDVARVCGAVQAGKVNWPALATYDCPELSQYGLFKVANDPMQGGQGDGVMPYELNSTLFSDYSSKYRVIFLPPNDTGSVKPAVYRDQRSTGRATETLDFPVGTVISKTFTFRTENVSTLSRRVC
jgi:parallel beta-helix repeat protein